MEQELIVALLYPRRLSLDLIGPMEAFSYAIMQATGSPPYKLVVAGDTLGPVKTLSGIHLVAEQSFRYIRGPIGTLMIPGNLARDFPSGTGLSGLAQPHSPCHRADYVGMFGRLNSRGSRFACQQAGHDPLDG